MDPKQAGDELLQRLNQVTGSQVKGAHDNDFLILNGKAYIVYMANDVQEGEAADWPFVCNAMSVVDIASLKVEKIVTFAASEMEYDNCALPAGACFVPRIIQINATTLRCFFASEDPAKRQSQTWYIDYDIARGEFKWQIHPAEIETDQGIFPMQPQHLYNHLVAKGFTAGALMFGLYMIDGFKKFDGRTYAVLNNYPGGQLALATLNDSCDRLTVVAELFLPHEAKLTESAINRLPDGSWLAFSRQENRDQNYMFASSVDGRTFTAHEYRGHVTSGTNSKSTFDRFGNLYYLGWNEACRINDINRSVFNIDVSPDGINWQRKYRIETDRSFQYPTFREYDSAIYVAMSHGSADQPGKVRIMFGKLEELK